MKKTRLLATGLCVAMLTSTFALAANVPEAGTTLNTKKAYLQNFISDASSIAGENGWLSSPNLNWEDRAINIPVDVDGNAIQAVDEQDMRYFEGKYYLYGESFLYGTFNNAVSVNKDPVVTNTDPYTYHRYCGLTIYSSEDMMNWKLEDTIYAQDEKTGWLYTMKKPRVIYSEKTGKYNLWFLNGHTTFEGAGTYSYMTSDTPVGPWEGPYEQVLGEGVELGPDYELVDGPDGEAYIICSHNGIRVGKLNEERTGVVEQIVLPAFGDGEEALPATETLAGGIGMHWHQDKSTGKVYWYITGSARCGNCVSSPLYYVMAEDDPMGTWMSPVDKSTEENMQAEMITQNVMFSQVHSSKMLPDGEGGWQVLIPATHYLSNTQQNQSAWPANDPGESNEAMTGHFWFTLNYNDDGTIKCVDGESATVSQVKDFFPDVVEFPLANNVQTTMPTAYQGHLTITDESSVEYSWTLGAGETLASVMPSVFQRTPMKTPWPIMGPYPALDPMCNEPLHAKLTVYDIGADTSTRTVKEWDVDARTVVWAPSKIVLNLDQAYTAGEKGAYATLTLSTQATNGNYGIAVAEKTQSEKDANNSLYKTIDAGGQVTEWKNAKILIATSDKIQTVPTITEQPHGITVEEGSSPGFWVKAEGVGIGYQWYKDGEIVAAPEGNSNNETASPTLRLSHVTPEDAGTYYVKVFNQVGAVESKKITLTVIDMATVTFDSQEGSAVESQTIRTGGTIAEPEAPTRSGYTFGGWYTDPACTSKWNFADTVVGDMTLYAKWTANSSSGGSSSGGNSSSNRPDASVSGEGGKVSASSNGTVIITPEAGYQIAKITVNGKAVEIPEDGKLTGLDANDKVVVTFEKVTEEKPSMIGSFTDVSVDDWYADAVQYALDNELMEGVSDSEFAPNSTTTRAMIVTILYRLEGEPDAAASSFTDVAADSYYGDAVAWVQANGIVNGVSATSFAPNDVITREQMATILYRYADYKGYNVSVDDMSLADYADASQISSYATTAMLWANGKNLITGVTDTTLAPKGSATRAQVATILMRFCEEIA